MAIGWARDGAEQDQISATVDSAVQLARTRLPKGRSLTHCVRCSAAIPEARRIAMPGVRYCVACQSELESKHGDSGAGNRRNTHS
ncbi:MAG: DksA/TraR family C4-type zinc finger protein [Kiritimatiellae bacterium]|nr:DksA/TraR family C4-type zinc finger protein [Kiritimatiellia bacterium]